MTWQKRQKLERLAEAFLAATAAGGGLPFDVRFDVASVSSDARGQLSVYVFEAAF